MMITAGATVPEREKMKNGAVSLPATPVAQPSELTVKPSVHTPHLVLEEKNEDPRQRAPAAGDNMRFVELLAVKEEISSKFMTRFGAIVMRSVKEGTEDVTPVPDDRRTSPQLGSGSAPIVSSTVRATERSVQQSVRGMTSTESSGGAPSSVKESKGLESVVDAECENVVVLPSTATTHQSVADLALLLEHGALRRRLVKGEPPPVVDHARTSSTCKIKQFPVLHVYGPSVAGFQTRSVVNGGGDCGSTRTTSGGAVREAAVVHALAVLPVHNTSPVEARSHCNVRLRERPGHIVHDVPCVPRGKTTMDAMGSSPVTEKESH